MPVQITNAYDQASFVAAMRSMWASMGFKSSADAMMLRSPGAPPSGHLPRDHVIAHVDGKHSVVVFEFDCTWYPETDVYVYLDRLVQPSDVSVVRAKVKRNWRLAVPDGWKYRVHRDMMACDEEYGMCMGQSGSYTLYVAPDDGAGEPRKVAVRDYSWTMQSGKEGTDKLLTTEGLGDQETVAAVAAEIGQRVFGDAEAIGAGDGIWTWTRWSKGFVVLKDVQKNKFAPAAIEAAKESV